MKKNKWKASVDEYIGKEPILTPEKRAMILSKIHEKEKKTFWKHPFIKVTLTAALLSFLLINSYYLFIEDHEKTSSEQSNPINENESLHAELAAIRKENQELNGALARINSDLQITDGISRRIMSLLANNDWEELRREFQIEVNANDNTITFQNGETSSYFDVEWAALSMNFAYYNDTNDHHLEVGYYLFDSTEGAERKYLISFVYDSNYNFQYIATGDT